jgi:hypothetical protein
VFTSLVMLTFAGSWVAGAADSLLYVGAAVRVQAPSVAFGWLPGIIVRSGASPTCLAVKLDLRDGAGRQLYAFLRVVKALEVDERTNQGAMTIGLPPAEPSDWRALTPAELGELRERCRRR